MQDLSQIAQRASAWIGREEVATDSLSVQAVRRLAATLDLSPATFEDGTALPDGWHVVLFPPLAPTSELGQDGHPKKGDFLPDLSLPRRLFASRRVVFHKPLHIGDTVRRLSRIDAIEPKQGRSGLLAFVTVVHDFHGPDGLAVTEEQKIVYREEARGEPHAVSSGQKPEGDFPWSREITPSAALLFRYSAVTFNAHRIHYDHAYAQNAESYADRVVNGGLTAILILTFVASLGRGPLAEFSIRNTRPMFVDRPITLRGRSIENADNRQRAEFCAVDSEGFLGAVAKLTWRAET